MTQTLFDVDLYDVGAEDFTSDDWETPPEIARKMAALVDESEWILEPCAGRGAIVRELRSISTAIELKRNRLADGRMLAPTANWNCADFLKLPPVSLFDVVITNPPFGSGIEFIERSLLWLNPHNPAARLLFLLPGDYFASCDRNDRFEALDCHIHHRYRIRGRVAFIREGVQQQGRQISDCVYDIRPGKIGASETVL